MSAKEESTPGQRCAGYGERSSDLAAERLIETTIGLWADDDPPGKRPPRLAAAIVKELHDEGYAITRISDADRLRLRVTHDLPEVARWAEIRATAENDDAFAAAARIMRGVIEEAKRRS